MRVLMLGWELPPHHSGGLGEACYKLCRAMARQGVSIEFVLPYTAEHNIDFMNIHAAHPQHVRQVIKAGIAYESYKYVLPDGSIEIIDMYGQQDMYEHAVERLCEQLEFDVIHAHDWLTFRAALRAKEKSGRPLVLHVHALERDRAGEQNGGNPMVREIEEMALHLADRVVAVSQYTKDAICSEYGVPADRISVVHNSIDLQDVVPLDDTNGFRYLVAMRNQGYKIVVSVCRFTLQKGLPNLLRAARMVVDHHPKTLFVIAGTGEQYHELITLAADLGIQKNVIIIYDFLPRKYWRDALSIGDLFVMPSISEPFGLTPLEAIGYGTPALITHQSGLAEVLQNALKVDFWDIDEMANLITAVLCYPSIGAELLDQSTQEYNRLTWDTPATRVIELYGQHRAAVAV